MPANQNQTANEEPQGGMLTGNNASTSEPVAEQEESTASPQTFTFFEGHEGEASLAYLYEQRGLNAEATVEDLEAYFNADQSNRLREVFGTFDNYLGYMTEREALIQSGEYNTGNWAEADAGFTEDQRMLFEGDADLTVDASDPGQDSTNLARQQSNAQGAGYNNWLNSDANQALLEKYGINGTVYSDSGDKFNWNGSAYVKVDEGDNPNYMAMAVGALAGAYLGPALAGAMGGGAGGAAGAAAGTAGGVTSGITAGGVASAAAGQALSSAIIQGALTGRVDMSSVGQAAISGGLGFIADGLRANALDALRGTEAFGDAANALDNAVWDMADRLGTDYDTVYRMGLEIAEGVLTQEDVEDIALGAVQTYTTAELQNLVRTSFADQFGDVQVDNLFREGQTDLPINALNPLIETAVSDAFGEDVDAEDYLGSVVEGLTYEANPDEPFDQDMTYRFLDPGIDLEGTPFDVDLSGLGDALPENVREFGREVEDVARAIGSETEDVVRDVVRPIGAVADDIKEQLPHGTTPDFPSIDGPDIDLSLGLGSGGGGTRRGTMKTLKPEFDALETAMQIYEAPSASQTLDQAIQELTMEDNKGLGGTYA